MKSGRMAAYNAALWNNDNVIVELISDCLKGLACLSQAAQFSNQALAAGSGWKP